MIPKIIHYCWFGKNPLPALAVKCIESWKKFFPDYEIKEWNEENFDVNIIPYTRDAYKAKKYAFVSDYARFWILYNYGGLYFDTDVEVIKSMDDIVDRGPFMGCEKPSRPNVSPNLLNVAPGLGLGTPPNLALYKELLDLYETLSFFNPNSSYNLTTVVEYTTQLLVENGLKNINEIQKCREIWIYPKEYFCPIDYYPRQCNITSNTRAIHYFEGSWLPKKRLFISKFFGKIIGENITHRIGILLRNMHIIK